MALLKTEKINTIQRLFSVVLLYYCLTAILITLNWFSIKNAVIWALSFPVWAFMLLALLRGDYRHSAYILSLCVIGWFALTRIIQGDSIFGQSRAFFVDFCMIYGFAFLFARFSQDTSRRLFDTALCVLVILAAILAWIGIFVWFGDGFFGFAENYPLAHSEDGYIWICGRNPNEGGVYMMLALLMAFYLLIRHWHPKWLILAVPVVIGLFWSMVMSHCRGAFYSLMAADIPLCGAVASQYYKKKKGRILVIALACLIGVTATYYSLNLTAAVINTINETLHYEEMTEQQNAILASASEEDEETIEELIEETSERYVLNDRPLDKGLSGRDVVLANVIDYFKAHPQNLWRGTPDRMVKLVTTNYGADGKFMTHLHSSFLQALVLLGLPGFLLIIAICAILFVYSVKILFGKDRTTADRLIPVLLLPFITDSLVYSCIFVPYETLASSTITNFLFFLTAGYVVEMGRTHWMTI